MDRRLEYTIEKYIATLKDNSYASIELNLMSRGNNFPKYNTRKWADNKPLKGVTLSVEELKYLSLP